MEGEDPLNTETASPKAAVWPPAPMSTPVRASEGPSVTPPRMGILCLILLFDVLVGGFLFLVFSAFRGTGDSGPDELSAYEAQWRVINSVNMVVALCGVALLFGASICIVACVLGKQARFGRGAYVLQRGAFWCFPLLTAILVLSLTMPSEGGVGGALMLMALPVYVVFTGLALWAALRLKPLAAGA